MRRFKLQLSLSIAVLATMLAGLAGYRIQANVTAESPTATLNTESLTPLPDDFVPKKMLRKGSAAKAMEASQVSGHYAEWDEIATSNGSTGYQSMTEIIVADDNSVTVKNLYNLGFNVTGTFDPEAATITVPSQFAFNESPYGDFWFCYFNGTGFSSQLPVVMQINQDGSITTPGSGWCVIIPDKQSAFYGSALMACTGSKFDRANASMSASVRQADKTFVDQEYPLYVYKSADDIISVANMTTQGKAVNIRLMTGKNVEVEPQVMSYSALVGAYCIYPAQSSGTTFKGLNQNLTGVHEGQQITFGPFGVFQATALTKMMFGANSGTITLPDGLSVEHPTGDAPVFEGEGTQASPYVIATSDDLIKLSTAVELGNNFAEKIFKLTADIDMKGISFRPIGNAKTSFDGTFDGDGHTISYLELRRGSVENTGLFGVTGNSALLKNLTLNLCTIEVYGKYAGILVGNSKGRIENCHTTGVLSSSADYLGGIAGNSGVAGSTGEISITGCSFIGTMKGVAYTGGIAGYAFGKISGCHVIAAINTSVGSASISHGVGGIAGGFNGTTSTPGVLEECFFVGSATDNSGYANLGGIVGQLSGKTTVVRRCANMALLTSNVTDKSIGRCGGIAGSCSDATIEDSYSSNNILAKNVTKKVAGLTGWLTGTSQTTPTIRNSYFSGQVIETGGFASDKSIAYEPSATAVIENVYFDAQMQCAAPVDSALTTEALTSGNPLKGFSTDVWNFTEGRYPTLKYLPEPYAGYSSAALHLSGTQSASNVKSDFPLTVVPDVTWKVLDDDSQYSDQNSLIAIENNTVKIKDKFGISIIAACITIPNGTFPRLYTLSVSPAIFDGKGTADDPYLIKTVDDVKALNTAITVAGQQFHGDFFKLANDIDFTSVDDFWGIGDDSNPSHYFNATFDGDGHAIHNWCPKGIVYDASGAVDPKLSRQTLGFFGNVGPLGVVKNLTMAADCNIEGYVGVGGVASIVNGRLENCRNYAKVTGILRYVAGVASALNEGASLHRCYNAGTITVNGQYVAGISAKVGENTTISECQNDGLVQAALVAEPFDPTQAFYAGGIASHNAKGNSLVNCVNNGTIKGSAYVGGIISGYATGSSMTGCLSNGLVLNSVTSKSIGAIAAEPQSKLGLSATYYNRQINPIGAAASLEVDGVNGVTSAALTAGTPLEGLSDEVFDFTEGLYPVLKAFKEEKASVVLRSMVVKFAENDSRLEMNEPATLAKNASWTLTPEGLPFVIADGILKTQDMTAPAEVTLAGTADGISVNIPIKAFDIPFEGLGTTESPYLIKTVADMNTLSTYTSEHLCRYTGKSFRMENDIDMSTIENFLPIAYGEGIFAGSFDGAGHTVSHLTINRAESNTDQNVGLFGTVSASGSIKNLTLDQSQVTGWGAAGGIVGAMYGSMTNCVNKAAVATESISTAGGLVGFLYAPGSITGCSNEGTIYSANTYAGGISGQAAKNTTVTSCVNKGKVSTATGKGYAAGIVAWSQADITDCVNDGEITANADAAGISAQQSNLSTVSGCVNNGAINVTASYVGGIVADLNSSTVTNCKNNSDIKGNGYVGGIVASSKESTVELCENYGNVEAIKSAYAGGIVGSMSGGSADDCVNYGVSVKSVSNGVGGIVGSGSTNYASISSCINYAEITATTDKGYAVGGIAGTMASNISDCINFGDITAESYSIGGISGMGAGRAYRCVNAGNVKTTYNLASKKNGNAAGIWGHAGTLIADCINYGNVEGIRYVGGISAYPSSTSAKIKRCYVYAGVTGTDQATTGAIAPKCETSWKLVVDSAYYCPQLCPALVQSEASAALATPLTALEMRTAKLGDAFSYHKAALPTLPAFAENPDLNFMAAMVVFADGETVDDVKSPFEIADLQGISWIGTANLEIHDGIVKPKPSAKNEEATLTLTTADGGRERIYELVLTGDVVSGIDGITADGEKTVTSRRYFDLRGIETAEPLSDAVTIEVVTYDDGTSATRKLAPVKK